MIRHRQLSETHLEKAGIAVAIVSVGAPSMVHNAAQSCCVWCSLDDRVDLGKTRCIEEVVMSVGQDIVIIDLAMHGVKLVNGI